DLGAMLCRRSKPACDLCPIRQDCQARAQNRQHVLPEPRPRKERPQRTTCMLLAVSEEKTVLLERRPPAGLWGGLWGLPEFESAPAAEEWFRLKFGAPGAPPRPQPPLRHAFTH